IGRGGVTYVSVADYVEEQLGSMPEEAREIYATNHESAARVLLDRGRKERDPDPLIEASRLYPIAPSGMEALGLLARWDLQNARWPAAVARFRSLLRRDRFNWDERNPEVLSLGLALYRNDQAGDLEILARNVLEILGTEKGSETAAKLKSMAARIPKELPKSFWQPRMGVDTGGTGVTSQAVKEAPKSWTADLPKPPLSHSGMQNSFKSRDGFDVRNLLESAWRPYRPSVVDDRVFVHNGIEFLCFDLLRGKEPLWRQSSFYSGGSQVGNANFEPNRVFSATLEGDKLFVLMEIPALAEGLDSRNYHSYEVIPAIPRRRLLALDPRTGRLLWEAGAKERPLTFMDHLSFCTEPLSMDGRLYLAGAIFEGIPTAFAIALDAEDGSLIWKRRICAGSQELNMFGRPVREYCGSPISAVGDALFFCTNLGAVASLRATDGAWRWLFRYPPNKKAKSISFETIKVPPAWLLGPVVATAERVVVAPTDTNLLFGLDPNSGTCRWVVGDKKTVKWGWSRGRIPRPRNSWLNAPFYLLGTCDGRVVVHGESVKAFNLRSGKPLWTSEFDANSESPAGAGAMAGDRVYVPTDKALYIIDVKTGKRLRRDAWANPLLESGNVSVAGGFIITAAKERLNCFYDRELLEKRITKAAAERPKDPNAALRAARVCLKNGNLGQALKFYRKVQELALPGSKLAKEAKHGIYMTTVDLAEEARKRGDRADAAALWEKALVDAPGKREKLETLQNILDYHRLARHDGKVVKIFRGMMRDFR
ncbi:MAG: outer membrane protein assembly factor BamB family protein, partial [Planctomycetota bacterium]